eukprot:TRINITY_DN2851_c0_g3_i1.p1 TRINITY_DN2851_c0_g3~~TRINITY_DN2851_c0_g3_i1.p1  ORF type:complete len:430 (+),score=85.58 TRINITY_DN2851_c0_g3_i1:208-1497(+)
MNGSLVCLMAVVVLTMFLTTLHFFWFDNNYNNVADEHDHRRSDPTKLQTIEGVDGNDGDGGDDDELKGIDLERTRRMACADPILKELTKQKDRLRPDTFDMVRVIVENMNLLAQRTNVLRPIRDREGFYIRDTETLRRKMTELGRCDRSDARYPKVAVCTMQHSNGPHIQEFLAHYLLLGCSKIFIYDNSKPDTIEWKYFREVVQPFVDADVVEVEDWYWPTGDPFRPVEAFQSCVSQHKTEYDWIAVVDNDEFLIIHEPHPQCLNELLVDYEQYGGLVVHWRLMSPLGGGAYRDPSRLMMDQYRYQIEDHGGAIKTIVHTKYWSSMLLQHHASYVPDRHAVDFEGNIVTGPGFPRTPMELQWQHIELRHFYGRDWMNYLYEKLCSSTQLGIGHYFTPRILRFFDALLSTQEVPTETQHSESLRKFLFG